MLFGQIEKGQIYVWGNLNFSTNSSENEYKIGGTTTTIDGPKITNFGIMPAVGYFLSDNLAVGLFVGFDSYKNESTDPATMLIPETKNVCKQSMFDVGPWARYYIMPWEKTGFYFEGVFGFGTGKDKDESTPVGSPTTSTETDISEMFVAFCPGVVCFVSKKVALEAEFGDLSYYTFKEKYESGGNSQTYKENGINFEINPSTFKFGVAIHL